mmetsp:Transcript_30313/g.61822  ORF Transcript_30313/g.61822 Transcript_30313/m.61822 type:complete len:294 (+) Transcript_30313:259-1140(+)
MWVALPTSLHIRLATPSTSLARSTSVRGGSSSDLDLDLAPLNVVEVPLPPPQQKLLEFDCSVVIQIDVVKGRFHLIPRQYQPQILNEHRKVGVVHLPRISDVHLGEAPPEFLLVVQGLAKIAQFAGCVKAIDIVREADEHCVAADGYVEQGELYQLEGSSEHVQQASAPDVVEEEHVLPNLRLAPLLAGYPLPLQDDYEHPEEDAVHRQNRVDDVEHTQLAREREDRHAHHCDAADQGQDAERGAGVGSETVSMLDLARRVLGGLDGVLLCGQFRQGLPGDLELGRVRRGEEG